MTREAWRPIDGWPYEVSDLGRVRRVTRASGTRPYRVLKPLFRDAYPGVRLSYAGRTQAIRIHRLVAITFLGPQPSPLHEVAHGDGDPSNSRLTNLRWATRIENRHDMRAHGTHRQGQRMHNAKLTDQAVRIIRGSADSIHRLAAKFGVSGHAVWLARTRLTWKHVA